MQITTADSPIQNLHVRVSPGHPIVGDEIVANTKVVGRISGVEFPESSRASRTNVIRHSRHSNHSASLPAMSRETRHSEQCCGNTIETVGNYSCSLLCRVVSSIAYPRHDPAGFAWISTEPIELVTVLPPYCNHSAEYCSTVVFVTDQCCVQSR